MRASCRDCTQSALRVTHWQSISAPGLVVAHRLKNRGGRVGPGLLWSRSSMMVPVMAMSVINGPVMAASVIPARVVPGVAIGRVHVGRGPVHLRVARRHVVILDVARSVVGICRGGVGILRDVGDNDPIPSPVMQRLAEPAGVCRRGDEQQTEGEGGWKQEPF